MKRRKETDRFRERVDLGARHTAEARFHDQKYASGHSFPRHYRVSPTYPVSQRLLALVGMELAGQRVLEYGCGNGWITAQLAERGAAVSAFDVSPEAVRQTTALLEGQGLHLRASVRVMPGEHLDYQSCSFDSAIGFAILHHLDLDSALPELHRVLKPGGRAFFAEPLASNGLVRLYRRLTPQFRTVDERPIDIAEFACRVSSFSRFEHHDQLLLAMSALALCYVPGLGRLARPVQRILMRVDDVLLRAAPSVGRWAWYSILVLEK